MNEEICLTRWAVCLPARWINCAKVEKGKEKWRRKMFTNDDDISSSETTWSVCTERKHISNKFTWVIKFRVKTLSESQSKSSWAKKKFRSILLWILVSLLLRWDQTFVLKSSSSSCWTVLVRNLIRWPNFFFFSSCIENWLENGDFPQSKKKLFLPLAVFTATHQKQNFHLAEHNQALPEGERRNGVCGRTCTSKLSPKLSLSYTIGVPKSLPVFALVFLSAVFFLFWITIWAIF